MQCDHRSRRTGLTGGLLRCLPLLLALLSACAQQPRLYSDNDCARRLAAFEEQARNAGVFLSEPRSVTAFPAVASSRFLASFDPQALTAKQRRDWWQRLLAAGERRRKLLADMLNAAAVIPAVTAGERMDLERCARREADAFLASSGNWKSLADALHIADDYSLWRRTLGAYPLTSLGARAGVHALQAELLSSYSLPPDALPTAGTARIYEPGQQHPRSGMGSPSRGEHGDGKATDNGLRRTLARDSLGALLPDGATLSDLLQQHAPIWHLDQLGSYDRPGIPYFDHAGRPRVDSARPSVFAYASLTRVDTVAQLQLNYLMWFDARPRQGVFDTLGGRLDGLLWRVTLDESAAVLLYDSVHACGCYHLFFPGPRLTQKPATREWPEPPLVVQAAPALEPGERPVLWVSSQSHYLQGLSASADGTGEIPREMYTIRDYASLYAVEHPAGTRSLFDRNGIVPGTERAERFYLWPMGIRSPGAMRERGRHATAFVGRRHFDDPDLLNRIFLIK